MVRIAQGLVHMGKGTLTLNPYHNDNQLMSPVSVAGYDLHFCNILIPKTNVCTDSLGCLILNNFKSRVSSRICGRYSKAIVIAALLQLPFFNRLLGCILPFLDVKSTILSKSHYLLYALSTAIQPRMLVTFDEELRPLPVSVRVGQAVDVVGQAGKPKTITGFQTHTTPVLLSYGERAELATEEYIPVTPIMEGFVILKKNPDY